MKKLIIFFSFFFVLSSQCFSQIELGVGGNYISENALVGVGGKALYTFTEKIAGQLAVHYVPKDEADFVVDLDVHYDAFSLSKKTFSLTPFIGINFFGGVTVTSDNRTVAGQRSSTKNMNIGLNGIVKISDALKIYFQPKLILGKTNSFAISSGVYF